MKFIRMLPTNRYCVVEEMVHEVVAKEGNIEMFEHFLKTYVMGVESLPIDLLPPEYEIEE